MSCIGTISLGAYLTVSTLDYNTFACLGCRPLTETISLYVLNTTVDGMLNAAGYFLSVSLRKIPGHRVLGLLGDYAEERAVKVVLMELPH